jgi:hypothetical protein
MFTPRTRSLFLLTAAAVSASLVAAMPAGAADLPARTSSCPSCGHNLIKNPGAEAGKGTVSDTVVKVPGWKQKGGFTAAQYAWSGGDLSKTSPGPKHRGKNYFYGGPDAAVSTGTQVVGVSGRAIGKGKVRYKLAGWLGGYDSQGDYATLTVTFEKADGAAIRTARIGPVTEAQRKGTSKLLPRARKGTVPAATRLVKIQLVMIREAGSDNDGLADNLTLVFRVK